MRIKISSIMCIICFSLFPHISSAATFYFDSISHDFKTGEKVYVDVYIDPENEVLNAVDLSVIYPQEYLEYTDYHETGSIISTWVDTPSLNGNSINFAGIIPGGFSGVIDPSSGKKNPGRVVRLLFVAKADGQGSFSLSDAHAYLHDGSGTSAVVHTTPYQFSISSAGSTFGAMDDDRIPPENFTPLLRQDNVLFNGKYFLVFQAKDAGSGIDSYRVKEGKSPWISATSPYLLQDQTLGGTIRVMAVDKNGNTREEHISLSQNEFAKAGTILIIVLAGLLVAVIVLAYVFLNKKSYSKNKQ